MSGFLKSNNLEMAKVPYRDIMQGPNDLAENRIQLLSSSLAIVTPLIHAGRIKILAVTGRQRAASVPDVPTVREPAIRRWRWKASAASSGRAECCSPRANRSRPTCGRRGERPEHRGSSKPMGQIVDVRGPAEFAAGIKQLRDQLAGIGKEPGMKAVNDARRRPQGALIECFLQIRDQVGAVARVRVFRHRACDWPPPPPADR